MTTVILRTAARGLTPVAVILAMFFLIRGHNDPGGGFIAGLVLGAGIVLRWLAFGVEGVGRLLPVPPVALLGAGLVLAVGTGLVPVILGDPFLSGALWEARLLGIELKVASSLFFDVGVVLVVLGMVGAFVQTLGDER
jgi:multisubunit Na+/H+ antiporter MnhB subunit